MENNQIIAKIRATRKGQTMHTPKGRERGGKGKDGRQWYVIRQGGKGGMSCTCPDWIYRRRQSGIPCKHIKFLKEQAAAGTAFLHPDIKIENVEVF